MPQTVPAFAHSVVSGGTPSVPIPTAQINVHKIVTPNAVKTDDGYYQVSNSHAIIDPQQAAATSLNAYPTRTVRGDALYADKY